MNTDTRPAALDTIRALTEQRHDLDHTTYAAVLDARLAGATWTAIGQALGVTAQAAHKRYHGAECNRPRCTDHQA